MPRRTAALTTSDHSAVHRRQIYREASENTKCKKGLHNPTHHHCNISNVPLTPVTVISDGPNHYLTHWYQSVGTNKCHTTLACSSLSSKFPVLPVVTGTGIVTIIFILILHYMNSYTSEFGWMVSLSLANTHLVSQDTLILSILNWEWTVKVLQHMEKKHEKNDHCQNYLDFLGCQMKVERNGGGLENVITFIKLI